jgi:hypothetical protein
VSKSWSNARTKTLVFPRRKPKYFTIDFETISLTRNFSCLLRTDVGLGPLSFLCDFLLTSSAARSQPREDVRGQGIDLAGVDVVSPGDGDDAKVALLGGDCSDVLRQAGEGDFFFDFQASEDAEARQA